MTPDAIAAAEARIRPFLRRTPLLESPQLNDLAGRRVLVKAECLQHTGSFKYRGAKSAVTAIAAEGGCSGIIAYSSGNHAQGVARAAQEAGLPAVIVMPSDAPRAKVEGTRAYGAEVVLYDRWNESREEIGAHLAATRDLRLVRPYDEPEVIAGQGTCGLELAEQARAAGVTTGQVLVCCGGGGLTSGIALALEQQAPSLRVRPVEPAAFDDVTRSLAAGEILGNAPGSTSICDAIVTPQPGDLTFPILQRLCGPGLTVSDAEALTAMAVALRHLKIVVEPGGAVALAAALHRGADLGADPVIAVATGGNADPEILAHAVAAIP
ncbi:MULTISPECIES: threonine ammonia-lyase [unclassified Meridianimarinicoccus]|uniref:threonine ammonia-lyase n=1 Tax=unclassified Meridianimarinicoccus TaxID=2923344 RepID=UPI001865E38F|nr:threonine/serine dehydratase [Fluviibacterium sp. MJW13]